MKSPQSTYPLRLPRSVKAEVERRAKADGNQHQPVRGNRRFRKAGGHEYGSLLR